MLKLSSPTCYKLKLIPLLLCLVINEKRLHTTLKCRIKILNKNTIFKMSIWNNPLKSITLKFLVNLLFKLFLYNNIIIFRLQYIHKR